MKRRISLIALLAVSTLPLAPAAYAHDFGPRTIVVDGGYRLVHHPRGHYGVPPYWLRTHVPFQRWYYANRHRHGHLHTLSWLQLYDLYSIELRHSRAVRHHHHRGHRDHGNHRGHRGRGHGRDPWRRGR